MDKKPEKITIKIKKEDLGDLDEITIEVQQKQTLTEKLVDKTVDTVKEINKNTVITALGRIKKFLTSPTFLGCCLLLIVLFFIGQYIENEYFSSGGL